MKVTRYTFREFRGKKTLRKQLEHLTVHNNNSDSVLQRQLEFPEQYRGRIIVVWNKTVPVGWGTIAYFISFQDNKPFYFVNVYVSPQYRRQGIGTLIMKHLRKGLKMTIPVQASSNTKAGTNFYQSQPNIMLETFVNNVVNKLIV